MTGHPGASVPRGVTGDKLPVGLQIVGRRFEDAAVLRAAAAFEQLQPWAHAKPSLE
jgi:aspartyl-tRNA(Asn)/glutamyl-tRNA(Gln) amidotransferase subunit A